MALLIKLRTLSGMASTLLCIEREEAGRVPVENNTMCNSLSAHVPYYACIYVCWVCVAEACLCHAYTYATDWTQTEPAHL